MDFPTPGSRIQRACQQITQISLAAAVVLAPSLLTAQAQSPENTAPSQSAHRVEKRLVADYDSGSKYLDPPYSAAQIPYNKLTHIIHAGVPFNDDGSLGVPDGFLEPQLIKKAHAAGVRVMLLTGGNVPVLEGDPALLKKVVANLKKFVVQHNYDGVDLDWEYPSSAADTAVLYDLMSALRKALPAPRYQLSIDAAPFIEENYDVPHLRHVIDFFNIMTYDCAGPWTSLGHLNSPIFWDNNDPEPDECEPGASDKEAADIYLKDAPASQLNMGTPFYGYHYTNIHKEFGICPNAATTPDGFCDDTVLTVNYGPDIKKLVNRQGWQTFYDPYSFVPYMVKKNGSPGYITYDDPLSTFLRVWYVDWYRGLGGSFMWSLDADYDGHSQDLLDSMYDATHFSLPLGIGALNEKPLPVK